MIINYVNIIIFVAILGISCLTVVGQENFVKCKVKEKELKSVTYDIRNILRTDAKNDEPSVLIVSIYVKPNKINKDDLILISRHLKQKFCKEENLIFSIFDNKDVAKFYDMNVQSARNHFRGEYILNRITGKEYISFVTIPDYNGNPRARIKIDLNSKTN